MAPHHQPLQLHLVPQPGSRPEFLAACVPVLSNNAGEEEEDHGPVVLTAAQQRAWDALVTSSTTTTTRRTSATATNNNNNNQLVLEGYTRDGWAWKPGNSCMVDVTLKSVDGRNKLPGFVKYLKERQKSAYGRFGDRGILVVSYIQPTKGDPNFLRCRVALDLTAIPNCTLRPLNVSHKKSSNGGGGDIATLPEQRVSTAATAAAVTQKGPAGPSSALPTAKSSKPGGGGLLGKLVGAQKRTNQHMVSTYTKAATATNNSAPASGTPTASASTSWGVDDATNDNNNNNPSHAAAPMSSSPTSSSSSSSTSRTAQEVFAEFRQTMQDKMLDFDMAESDDDMRVTVTLSDHTSGLSVEDRVKVTMEVLKYMVYEAAEEVNEEWVVHKEPSEFVDEATFCVYKEGMAPPDVLEEINRAELPDEIKAQQRALVAERQRQADQANQHHLQQVVLRAAGGGGRNGGDDDNDDDGDGDDQLEALNQKKRDRRTIEDYERERRGMTSRKGRT